MYNQSQFLDESGNLDREKVQAHFLRVGKLDRLEKNQKVWVDDGSRWVKARLIRRIPGECWIAQLEINNMYFNKITVQSSNFGGVIAE